MVDEKMTCATDEAQNPVEQLSLLPIIEYCICDSRAEDA